MRVLVDTNILLRLVDVASAEHLPARAALEKCFEEGDSLVWCAQVMIEFWVVATRPKAANGLGWSVEKAVAELEDFKKAFRILPEPQDIHDRWLDLVAKHKVSGKQAHDARIVALMLQHEVFSILTFNRGDFERFDLLDVRSPLKAV